VSQRWVSQYIPTQRRVSELPTCSKACIYLRKSGQPTYEKEGIPIPTQRRAGYLSMVGWLSQLLTCGNLRLKVKSPCQTVIPKIIRGNRRLKIRSPVSDSDSHVLLIFRQGFPRIVVSINVRLSEVRIHEKHLQLAQRSQGIYWKVSRTRVNRKHSISRDAIVFLCQNH
jgi:hypothetical protein